MPQPPARKPPGELSWRFFGSLNPFPTSAKTRNVFFPSKSTSPPPSPRTPASNFNQRAGNHPDKCDVVFHSISTPAPPSPPTTVSSLNKRAGNYPDKCSGGFLGRRIRI
uniref:Uncharacterized protein n=1 Tax=Moniliophthora roreri TaxID=221103 RepID=A0A0W0G3K4_MONRR